MISHKTSSSSRLARGVLLRAYATLLAVAGLTLGTTALADQIPFDPDGTAAGNPQLSVSTFDYLPGNSLFANVGSLLVNKVDQQITHYVQARLGSLLDANGDLVAVNGMNSNFELTVVVGFSAKATVAGSNTIFQLDTPRVGAVNFFEIWYDANAGTKASDLGGTGFNDGKLILSGRLSSAVGVFNRAGTNSRFDQFGADDYGGLQSARVSGGAALKIDVTSADSDFFGVIPPQLSMALFNTSNITSFNQVDPSALFLGLGPNRGAINGTGTDFQVQSDPNSSFVVPEPASVLLAGVGGLAILLAARRRTRA